VATDPQAAAPQLKISDVLKISSKQIEMLQNELESLPPLPEKRKHEHHSSGPPVLSLDELQLP